MSNCIICNKTAKVDNNGTFAEFSCGNCGRYFVELYSVNVIKRYIELNYNQNRHVLSGIIYEMNPTNGEDKILTNENFESILKSVKVPSTLRDKLDKLLIYIYKNSKKFYDFVPIPTHSIAYAFDSEELRFMINALENEKIIEVRPNELCCLNIKGVEYVESLFNKRIDSDQCFVAMWFDKELDEIFSKYMIPSIEAKYLEGYLIPNEKSYKAIKIDWKEFNSDIIDNIIAEIRKSRFMIADFTGNRNGVYFEAGFAKGLGIEVIYTCKKDHMDKIHFDVNHQNYIIWENGEELYHKLRKRISSTII